MTVVSKNVLLFNVQEITTKESMSKEVSEQNPFNDNSRSGSL